MQIEKPNFNVNDYLGFKSRFYGIHWYRIISISEKIKISSTEINNIVAMSWTDMENAFKKPTLFHAKNEQEKLFYDIKFR